MGGDGGVIASNRRYMRGAGHADHTADLQRHATEKVKFNAHEAMTTCALTKTPLYVTGSTKGNIIVSDPYGYLYHKEAAVHALLKRKQQQQQQQQSDAAVGIKTCDMIGPQVRRLNDLYDVRFYCEKNVGEKNDSRDNTPICPVTGKVLTGSIPAILLVPGKSDGSPNVVSESSLKQLSPEEIEEEFGCIERKIRLAPPLTLLETIKEEVRKEHGKEEQQRKERKVSKNKRKRDRSVNNIKKRSIIINNYEETKETRNMSPSKSSASVGHDVKSRVDSAIKENAVFSSIFTNKNSLSKISEKEKRDNLFAR